MQYVLDHYVEPSFDAKKCGGRFPVERLTPLLAKYRRSAERKYGAGTLVLVGGRVLETDAATLGTYLAICEFALEADPHRGDGGIPYRRAMELWNSLRERGLVSVAWTRSIYSKCRTFLDANDIVAITGAAPTAPAARCGTARATSSRTAATGAARRSRNPSRARSRRCGGSLHPPTHNTLSIWVLRRSLLEGRKAAPTRRTDGIRSSGPPRRQPDELREAPDSGDRRGRCVRGDNARHERHSGRKSSPTTRPPYPDRWGSRSKPDHNPGQHRYPDRHNPFDTPVHRPAPDPTRTHPWAAGLRRPIPEGGQSRETRAGHGVLHRPGHVPPVRGQRRRPRGCSTTSTSTASRDHAAGRQRIASADGVEAGWTAGESRPRHRLRPRQEHHQRHASTSTCGWTRTSSPATCSGRTTRSNWRPSPRTTRAGSRRPSRSGRRRRAPATGWSRRRRTAGTSGGSASRCCGTGTRTRCCSGPPRSTQVDRLREPVRADVRARAGVRHRRPPGRPAGRADLRARGVGRRPVGVRAGHRRTRWRGCPDGGPPDFLGNEFLLWLWFLTDRESDTVALADGQRGDADAGPDADAGVPARGDRDTRRSPRGADPAARGPAGGPGREAAAEDGADAGPARPAVRADPARRDAGGRVVQAAGPAGRRDRRPGASWTSGRTRCGSWWRRWTCCTPGSWRSGCRPDWAGELDRVRRWLDAGRAAGGVTAGPLSGKRAASISDQKLFQRFAGGPGLQL